MKKIIIVGSVKTIVDRESTALSRSEFKIFATTSPDEALNNHAEEKADLIISELELFGMGGDELCKVIRSGKDNSEVPVILISYIKEDSMRRCRECGANDHMTKPVDLQELSDKVAAFLNAPARKGMRVLTTVKLEGRSGSGHFFGKTEDISSSGLLLRTDRKMEKGERLECSFFLGSVQIEVKGEIVRCVSEDDHMYKYGIKFFDLTDNMRTSIEEFISGHISAHA
ncbi:MAG: PilZ domain-containing protein [Nitrospirota bacterium]|nr:MAG: PilZ domain-containing protein [Nitrospirota bacterium]